MDTDDKTTETQTEAVTGNESAKGASEKTFTQDEVNTIMGDTRREAKSVVEKEIADTLGVTVDEAKAIVGRHREAEKAAMTEAERAAAEAQDRETAAAARDAESQAKLWSVDVTLALIDAGVTDPTVRAEAAVLVMAKLDTSGDPDPELVTTAVDTVRAAVPSMFDGNPKPPSGQPTGGRPPSGRVNTPTQSAIERGRERARAMQGRSKTSS